MTNSTADLTLLQVSQNELILKNIFNYLDEQSIDQCLQVSQHWHSIAKSVDRPKRKVCQIISIFLLERFASYFQFRFRILNFTSPLMRKSIDAYIDEYYLAAGRKGPELFEDQFLESLEKSYARPNFVILLEGNNIKIAKKRRWKRAKVINAIRSSLPHDCSVIGIDAHYGIIGESSRTTLTETKDSVAVSFEISGLFGISSLALPKYEGFNVTIFERSTDEFEEEFHIPDDIKAVVLFSSGVSSKGGYLVHPQVDAIFEHFEGRLALGGAQVNDKLITNQPTVRYFSDDTANFYFVNGPPPYNAMFNPKKMSLIGIQFSGPNCQAASLSIEEFVPSDNNETNDDIIGQEIEYIKSKLMKFKAALPFSCDSNGWSSESIGFLFFNFDHHRRYVDYSKDVNAGASIFYKVFPKTYITGILCHAQYEHNFIPKTDLFDNEPEYEPDNGVSSEFHTSTNFTPNDSKHCLLPAPRNIASFVIIRINK